MRGGTRIFGLTFERSAHIALARNSTLRVVVRGKLTDAAGNSATVSKRRNLVVTAPPGGTPSDPRRPPRMDVPPAGVDFDLVKAWLAAMAERVEAHQISITTINNARTVPAVAVQRLGDEPSRLRPDDLP